MPLGFSPTTQPVASAGRLLREATKDAEDMDFGKMFEDITDITGYMTGYPLPAVSNLIHGWGSVINDETEHPVAKALGYGNFATGDNKR